VDKEKLYQRIKSGSRNNIRFGDFTSLIETFGFSLIRTNGSHHSFTKPDIPRLVVIQPNKGQAKAYQVKQFLELIQLYQLKLED